MPWEAQAQIWSTSTPTTFYGQQSQGPARFKDQTNRDERNEAKTHFKDRGYCDRGLESVVERVDKCAHVYGQSTKHFNT